MDVKDPASKAQTILLRSTEDGNERGSETPTDITLNDTTSIARINVTDGAVRVTLTVTPPSLTILSVSTETCFEVPFELMDQARDVVGHLGLWATGSTTAGGSGGDSVFDWRVSEAVVEVDPNMACGCVGVAVVVGDCILGRVSVDVAEAVGGRTEEGVVVGG